MLYKNWHSSVTHDFRPHSSDDSESIISGAKVRMKSRDMQVFALFGPGHTSSFLVVGTSSKRQLM